MKKISAIAMAALALLASCEPICEQYDLGESITAEQLKAASSVTVVKENGVNVNRIKCNSTAKALTCWTNGVEVKPSAYAEFTMLVLGEQTAVVTAFNPDGTTVTAEFPIHIEQFSPSYPVAPEWGMLFGTGEKDWGWASDNFNWGAGMCWGNAGYQCGGPEDVANGNGLWWGVDKASINGQCDNYGYAHDGGDAVMTFQLAGTKVVKETGSGTVKFDMTPTNDSNIGTLTTTGAGLLFPCQINTGNKVEEFEINRLNDSQLVLTYSTSGAWGESTYWRFEAK